MRQHHITKYWEDGKHYAEAWLQINIFGKERIMRLIVEDALAMVKFHGYPEIEITPSDVNAEANKRGWNDAIDAIIECEPSIDAVPNGR